MKALNVQIEDRQHEWIRRQAFERRMSMSDIVRDIITKSMKGESSVKKGETIAMGLMTGARIDLDEVRTAYSNGVTEYEAIQIPWDTVRAILGHDHTGDSDEDRRLVDALLAAGAPEWVRDAEGWVDEHGWGLIGPEFAGAGNHADEYRVIYSDHQGTPHEAIQLPWDVVRGILGRDHDSSGEDDARLIKALREMGAPEWIDDAEGWVDERGWGLIGPQFAGAGDDD